MFSFVLATLLFFIYPSILHAAPTPLVPQVRAVESSNVLSLLGSLFNEWSGNLCGGDCREFFGWPGFHLGTDPWAHVLVMGDPRIFVPPVTGPQGATQPSGTAIPIPPISSSTTQTFVPPPPLPTPSVDQPTQTIVPETNTVTSPQASPTIDPIAAQQAAASQAAAEQSASLQAAASQAAAQASAQQAAALQQIAEGQAQIAAQQAEIAAERDREQALAQQAIASQQQAAASAAADARNQFQQQAADFSKNDRQKEDRNRDSKPKDDNRPFFRRPFRGE